MADTPCPFCGSLDLPRRMTDRLGQVIWCNSCHHVWEIPLTIVTPPRSKGTAVDCPPY